MKIDGKVKFKQMGIPLRKVQLRAGPDNESRLLDHNRAFDYWNETNALLLGKHQFLIV